jgi:hypothetical protein
MKRILCTAVLLALAFSGIFAQEEKGLSAKIDIDANLMKWTHTDVKNDEYVSPEDRTDADVANVMANPNYDDVEAELGYTDPEDRFGGLIGFDFPSLLPETFAIGDLYAWGRVTQYARLKMGKYTDRVIEKIGGDKDLGVLSLDFTEDDDLSIGTTDSLGLGDDVIGFLFSGYYGFPANESEALLGLSFFAAPDTYHRSRTYSIPGTSPVQTFTVDAYYSYKLGGALRFDLEDIVSVGASYRQQHTEGTTQVSTGDIYNDYGLYAEVNALKQFLPGFGFALGYSGQIAYEDGDDPETAPVKHGVHFDLKYTGVEKLSIGLYNNASFYTLARENTLYYDEDIAAAMDIYTDESSLVLYNELNISYDLFEFLTPSLMVRNYYGALTGNGGRKDQDYGKNILTVELKAAYKISEFASVRAGVKFENITYMTPVTSVVLKNSNYAISIPVGITVQW